jgi:guanosine-3',5'-bis(diphosphate) 3'-pyrophosphohydrolase
MRHALEVAELVREADGSVNEIAAAILHDVVEDTDATLEAIRIVFGEEIAFIVAGLTDAPEMESLPTLERKNKQAQKLLTMPDSVKRPKLADQTSNLRDVYQKPPAHWSREKCLDYIRGAWIVAQACKGASPLLDRYFQEAYGLAMQKYG